MISGNVQNLLLEENLDEDENTGNLLAGTIEKGMRSVLSTMSKASPANFNIKDTKLLQPPSNRIGTLRHRSTPHTVTHQLDTSSYDNNKKVAESKDTIEDKTVSSASDDKFEQVRIILGPFDWHGLVRLIRMLFVLQKGRSNFGVFLWTDRHFLRTFYEHNTYQSGWYISQWPLFKCIRLTL